MPKIDLRELMKRTLIANTNEPTTASVTAPPPPPPVRKPAPRPAKPMHMHRALRPRRRS